MGILSEEEKQEIKSLASSAKMREEFRQLRLASSPGNGQPVNTDYLLSFLTAMTRLSSVPIPPKPFLPYSKVRI
jgi:hypothetical protein